MKLPFSKKSEKETTQVRNLQSAENLAAQQEFQKAEKSYNRDIAITTSVPFIKKIAFGAWMVFDIVLVGFFVVYLGLYLSNGIFSDSKLVARIGNNSELIQENLALNSAVALEVADSKVFTSGNGAYDLFTEVTNNNTDWEAVFTYYFTYNGGQTQPAFGFVLPKSTIPLVDFAGEYASRPSSVELVITDLSWRRLDPHQISNPSVWLEDHNNISFENVKYGLSAQDGPVASSSFDVVNNSSYGYWEFPMILILERSGSILAVNKTTISGFESGESRSVTVNWFGGAPASGSLRIIPVVDYLDLSVYMDSASISEVDLRELF